MARRNPAIIVAVISGVVAIVVAAVQFGPNYFNAKRVPDKTRVIAGRVVDAESNDAIPRADISLGGASAAYVSEDNGNFRIEVGSDITSERVRIRVEKQNYLPWDRTVGVPIDDLIVQLRKK